MRIKSMINVPVEADVTETVINDRRVLAIGSLRVPEGWLYAGIPAPIVSGTYMHTEGHKAIVQDAAQFFDDMQKFDDPFQVNTGPAKATYEDRQ